MRKLILVIIATLVSITTYSQDDSVKVFVIGNKTGERYKFYYNSKLILKFRGSSSYKYSFNIPIETTWVHDKSTLNHLHIYRQGRFGLKYRDLNLYIPYRSFKYLVIRRSLALKNRYAFNYEWQEYEPKIPVDTKRY